MEIIKQYCKRDWEKMLWNSGRDLDIFSYGLSNKKETVYKIIFKNHSRNDIKVHFLDSSVMFFYQGQTQIDEIVLIKHCFIKIEVPDHIKKEDISYTTNEGAVYLIIHIPFEKPSLFERNSRMSEPKLFIEEREVGSHGQYQIAAEIAGMTVFINYDRYNYHTYLPYHNKIFASSALFTDCDLFYVPLLVSCCKWYFDISLIHVLEKEPLNFYRTPMNLIADMSHMQILAYGFTMYNDVFSLQDS
ncbi:unnamed protein product [Bursaphelenchus xylophilus]|uniref:(pine wood nematode) hypothetical protein n=1 Tax=Bursaphelenchus xylophilus TaxID=6326 RepID=A0A1I7RSS1_BURXY|nr:unnamed protein product [Bursaphelenchus xylophilus]CAG9122821.1 unnamed protein product [Bursaphelenchus xylophilus]